MRGSRRRAGVVARRLALTTLSGVLGALCAPLLAAPVPAVAAPSCGNTVPPTGGVISSLPWAQQRFGLDRLTGIADGGGQTVAVVDSGVDAVNPHLAGAVKPGINAMPGGGNGQLDCHGHGTAVASIIAGREVPGVEFRGVAPAATILPVRVSEQQEINGQTTGQGVTTAQLAQAINQTVAQRPTVINISMTTYEDNAELRAAIANAVAQNIVVVAAAGNNHSKGDPTPYPAAYPGVIGVGAIGQDGLRATDSQVGPYVDLVAPGSDIIAALPKQGHNAGLVGTSFATPFVAGAAALVRQYHPGLSAADVVARMVATADPAPGGPRSNEYGAGVVNPYRAVTEQVGGTPVQLAPLGPRPGDRDAAARARIASTKHWAFGIAASVAGVALIVTVTTVVLPAGRRRRWRPGLRVHAAPPTDPDPEPTL